MDNNIAYAAMYNVSGDPAWPGVNSGYTLFSWYHLGETNGIVQASIADSNFTITVPGLYLVSVAIGMSIAEINDSANMMLYKNGVQYPAIQINPNVDPSGQDWATGTAIGLVRCAAGDVLDFRGQTNTGSESFNMQASSMTVVRLSGA